MKKRKVHKSLPELQSWLVSRLLAKKPVFHCHRTLGSVRVDVNGTTTLYIEIAKASDNVGVSFQSKRSGGGKLLPMVFAKDDQLQRKQVAYICAALATVVDDRPSEERREPVSGVTDPKQWYDAFSAGSLGEISESFALYQDLTKACKYVIDVYGAVTDAVKSARREDVRESIDRVKKELPFLVGRLSSEEWLELFHTSAVELVHET